MCKIMEDMRNEAALRERKDIAYTLVLLGKLSYKEIAESTKLPIEEIKEMAGRGSDN